MYYVLKFEDVFCTNKDKLKKIIQPYQGVRKSMHVEDQGCHFRIGSENISRLEDIMKEIEKEGISESFDIGVYKSKEECDFCFGYEF